MEREKHKLHIWMVVDADLLDSDPMFRLHIEDEMRSRITRTVLERFGNGEEMILRFFPTCKDDETEEEQKEEGAVTLIKYAATEELVRCRDCTEWDEDIPASEGRRWCCANDRVTLPAFFCADGKRREKDWEL